MQPSTPTHRVDNPGLSLSPSLARDGISAPAYELKFLLTEEHAAEVETRLGGQMSLDPHGRPEMNGGYRITSVYCDTPAFDVYYRSGIHRRRKHRIRRYGNAQFVFLERKSKRGGVVRKRRINVDLNGQTTIDWSQVAAPNWFAANVLRYGLRPVCYVSYVRKAFFAPHTTGGLRLTFDRELIGDAISDWIPPSQPVGKSLLEEGVVCEFKFRGDIPEMFKDVILSLNLTAGSISKYRRCLTTSQLVASNLPEEMLGNELLGEQGNEDV